MDFTIKRYVQLLESLLDAGFFFQTFAQYIENPKNHSIVLRHDVDARPANSLRFAQIQAEHGVVGTYYFRIVPQSYDERIIRQIAGLGHEIGYHYETMDTCNGDVDKAYQEFCFYLEIFRKVVEIKTISMHGSPISKFDNRQIWENFDYKKLGILAEPYFDVNFNEQFYLTDTGRRWDGYLYNVRDKATKANPLTNEDFLMLRFRHTKDIIRSIKMGTLPEMTMFNFHPQRWNDAAGPWLKELVLQNIKNQAKRILILLRK